MFIKIYHGNSEKYLLLQSNSVTLDKKERLVYSEFYPIVCAFLRPVDDVATFELITDKFHIITENSTITKEEQDITIFDFMRKLLPAEDYETIIPVLSDKEKKKMLDVIMNKDKEYKEPECAGNLRLSVVTVDGKTYITTGSIFITNNEGKTVDKA